jgi:6-pyruvoyltetrahydropterin/6-carboxytetrahydropterin synthase
MLHSDVLDNGQMVYDFGLMKGVIRDCVDSFDHAVTVWSKDDADFIAYSKRFSERCVVLPVSPSAEQFSRVIFSLIREALSHMSFENAEEGVMLHSVIIHETETAYAQCFEKDVDNERMGMIDLSKIEFSQAIQAEWKNPMAMEKILRRSV